MDQLCSLLVSCKIENKPVLYDMMIYDFASLCDQYNNSNEYYTFNMNSEFDLASFDDINGLVIYIQNCKCEDILIKMINQKFGNIFIDHSIIQSMIDYYLECLFSSC